MRGKVNPDFRRIADTRITPAHAGKSSTPSGIPRPGKDHPRACGEKFLLQVVFPVQAGSPPRMRGKVVHQGFQNLHPGITPAHAGKSLGCWRPRAVQRDHPRACGEKQHSLTGTGRIAGSPPRMRGKGTGCRALWVLLGITPAHAGKRACLGLVLGADKDHPRACGEKYALAFQYF